MVFRSLLGQAATYLNETITNRAEFSLLSAAENSAANIYAVKEMSRSQAADVSRFPVAQRSENSILIMYGPITDKRLSPASHVIILHDPGVPGKQSERMFSVYRSNDELQATTCFVQFKESLPTLVAIDPYVICKRDVLDMLCTSLRENVGWSAVHLAAAHNYASYFERPLMKEHINLQASVSLKTPLHVAVEYKNREAVQALLDLGVTLDLFDERGNTVLHVGADKNVTILNLLLREVSVRFPAMIEMKNADNCTPLHIACKSNAPECVKALLVAGADVHVPFNKSYPIHMAVNSRSACSVKEIVERSPDQLQLRDLVNGGTPLHWARGPETIGLLLELGCDPRILDNDGRSALHKTVKELEVKSVLLLLSHKTPPDLQDENGETALHIASRYCSRVVMQALIVFGANVNVLNKRGESARHIVCTTTERGITPESRDEALFFLDKVGAKRCKQGFGGPNSVPTSPTSSPSTSTAAVSPGSPSPSSSIPICTRGCSHEGKFGGTPPDNYPEVDNSNLMDECLACFSISNEMRQANSVPYGLNMTDPDNNLANTSTSSFGSSSQDQSHDHGRRTSPDLESSIGGRVLCLDGGGIRGLVLTQTLLVIEEILGVPIADMFDWIAGTSTGGILSLGLASGKSVLELQALYMRLKDRVFTGSRPYSSIVMEEFLKKEFGEHKTMGNITHPRVMITTAIVDSRPAEFHFFRNYLSPHSILHQFQNRTAQPSSPSNGNNTNSNAMEVDMAETEDEADLRKFVWQVAKWTGAAPSFFSVEGRYIDGGLVANNPTLDCLTELFQFSAAMRAVGDFKVPGVEVGGGALKIPSVVLSLGCGIQPKCSINTDHLDIAWPKGVIDAFSTLPRIHTLVNLLVDQATQAEGHIVENARAWCSSIGVPFFRFSPPCPVFVDLDETKDDVLLDLMWITRAYVLAQRSKLEELRQILIQKAPPGRNPNQAQHTT